MPLESFVQHILLPQGRRHIMIVLTVHLILIWTLVWVAVVGVGCCLYRYICFHLFDADDDDDNPHQKLVQ